MNLRAWNTDWLVEIETDLTRFTLLESWALCASVHFAFPTNVICIQKVTFAWIAVIAMWETLTVCAANDDTVTTDTCVRVVDCVHEKLIVCIAHWTNEFVLQIPFTWRTSFQNGIAFLTLSSVPKISVFADANAVDHFPKLIVIALQTDTFVFTRTAAVHPRVAFCALSSLKVTHLIALWTNDPRTWRILGTLSTVGIICCAWNTFLVLHVKPIFTNTLLIDYNFSGGTQYLPHRNIINSDTCVYIPTTDPFNFYLVNFCNRFKYSLKIVYLRVR